MRNEKGELRKGNERGNKITIRVGEVQKFSCRIAHAACQLSSNIILSRKIKI